MQEETVAIIAVLILFIGLPWLVLHYVTQWRKANNLSPDGERMIEDVWKSARTMERRIEALESILDSDAPGWRKRHGEEH